MGRTRTLGVDADGTLALLTDLGRTALKQRTTIRKAAVSFFNISHTGAVFDTSTRCSAGRKTAVVAFRTHDLRLQRVHPIEGVQLEVPLQ